MKGFNLGVLGGPMLAKTCLGIFLATFVLCGREPSLAGKYTTFPGSPP